MAGRERAVLFLWWMALILWMELYWLPVHCHSAISYWEAKWVGPATVVFIQVAYFEKMTHRGNILSKTNFLWRTLWQNSDVPRIEISSIMRVPGACLMFLRIRWLLLHSQGGCALTSHQNSLSFVAPSMLAWMQLDWMTGRGDPVGNITDGSSIGGPML